MSKQLNRPSRDSVYMSVANCFAQRSTCLRKAVGACLVRNNHILGTGYNGSAKEGKQCDEAGCDMENGHCVRTVHAEINAVLSAACNGVSTVGATLYTTAQPCFRCEMVLVNAEISEVVYIEEYRDGRNGNNKKLNLRRLSLDA